MLGMLGSIFGYGKRDEWNEKPNITTATIEYSIPDNATPEERARIQNAMNEQLNILGMSKAEQLEYFKRKSGL